MIDYSLVLLKGLAEQADPAAYFGSTIGVAHWMQEAEDAGWVKDGHVTAAGLAEYQRRGLDKLPRAGRAYLWPDTSALAEKPK